MHRQDLHNLIARDRFTTLFKKLDALDWAEQSELRRQYLQLRASYQQLQNEKRSGVIHPSDASVKMAQLTQGFIALVGEICDAIAPNEKEKPSKPSTRINKEVKTGDKPVSKTTGTTSKSQLPQAVFFGFGVLALAASLALVFTFSCLNETQYTFLRILISIAAGFLGGFMLGTIEIRYSDAIKASGGVALLILFYLWNPAAGVVSYGDCNDISIKGTVYLDGKPTKNIQLRIQQAEKAATTNRDGIYKMTVSAKVIQKKRLDFYFTQPDTLVRLQTASVADWEDLNFELKTKEEPEIDPDPTPEEEEMRKPPKPQPSSPELTTLQFTTDAGVCENCPLKIGTESFETDANGTVEVPSRLLKPNQTQITIRNTTVTYYGNPNLNISY